MSPFSVELPRSCLGEVGRTLQKAPGLSDTGRNPPAPPPRPFLLDFLTANISMQEQFPNFKGQRWVMCLLLCNRTAEPAHATVSEVEGRPRKKPFLINDNWPVPSGRCRKQRFYFCLI